MEPQNFELQVYETYATRDPRSAVTGAEIEGSVGVTVTWGAAASTEPTLAFDTANWSACGAGPLTVYDEVMGGTKPIGTVTWTVATHAIVKVEPNTPQGKSRWTATPIVQLVRTFCPSDGSPPDTEITYTASDTVKGDWFPLAAS